MSTSASGEDRHILAIFDYDTGELLRQKNDLHIGHCNGMTFFDGHFYIGNVTPCRNQTEDDVDKYNVFELDQDLNIVKTHSIEKAGGANIGNISGITEYDDKVFVKHGSYIYSLDKNLNHTGGRSAQLLNPIYYLSGHVGITSQDIGYNGEYIFAGFYYGKSYNNNISLIEAPPADKKTDTTKIIHPFKIKTGDISDKANRRELQSFSFDKKGNLYVTSSSWAGDGGMDVTEFEGDGIPTTTLVAQWEKVPYEEIFHEIVNKCMQMFRYLMGI